jgi:hypothetical protein
MCAGPYYSPSPPTSPYYSGDGGRANNATYWVNHSYNLAMRWEGKHGREELTWIRTCYFLQASREERAKPDPMIGLRIGKRSTRHICLVGWGIQTHILDWVDRMLCLSITGSGLRQVNPLCRKGEKAGIDRFTPPFLVWSECHLYATLPTCPIPYAILIAPLKMR